MVIRHAIALCVLLFAVSALADAPDPKVLSQRAKAAFDAGDFKGAADLLEQAYALKPWPVLLYNLARAYQQGGNKQRAIDAYERYLKEDPSSQDAGAVRESVRQLKEELDHDAQLEAQARAERERSAREAEEAARAREAARAADERARHKASPWPWAITGLGAAGVSTGIVLGALALSSHASAVSDGSVSQAMSDQSAAQSFATVANVCFIAGGAIAALGIIWGIFDVRAASTTVHAQVGLRGLVLSGSF